MTGLLAALTIFIGSFLIFVVQPMVGRTILPAFGGTASSWVVCLCSFQTLLLLGYFHAHFTARASEPRKIIHIILLALSALYAALAILFWNKIGADLAAAHSMPPLRALISVIALAGFPYVMLSANTSLVQATVANKKGRSAYRLYALSNVGSLLGLFAYPFFLEPYVALTTQWYAFAVAIMVYAGMLATLLTVDNRTRDSHKTDENQNNGECQIQVNPAPISKVLWFILPAISCFLLNAITTHMTLDVMPMPMLWTLLLGLFLASYIIGFSGCAERFIWLIASITLLLFIAVCFLNGKTVSQIPISLSLLIYGGFLLAASSFLHAWLYRIRPSGRLLTRYYLCGAAGGAIGGLLASLVAPAIFSRVTEYPIAIFLTAAFAIAAPGLNLPDVRKIFIGAASIAFISGAALYFSGAAKETRPVVFRGRGFFGTIEVLEAKAKVRGKEGFVREFVHGTTIHGIQAALPGLERMPTAYYTPNALGYAIVGHPKYRSNKPMRVNITGLGIGVMFCYGRTNDFYRAYEISADAMRVATDTNLFTFLSDCPAQKDIRLGDARKGLEKELANGEEQYDVIILDAFTGDNIPYHLSTREAFDLYFKMLKPDGILAVNISNWHLQLEPFMKALFETYDIHRLGIQTSANLAKLAFGAKCAFFCRRPELLAPPPFSDDTRPIDFKRVTSMPTLPTDEKGSFLSLIRFSSLSH